MQIQQKECFTPELATEGSTLGVECTHHKALSENDSQATFIGASGIGFLLRNHLFIHYNHRCIESIAVEQSTDCQRIKNKLTENYICLKNKYT